MPDACCRPDYDAVFDARTARKEAVAYRRSGATGSTRRLVEAIRAAGVSGRSVLDIGGGIGVLGQELLAGGASRVTHVDASAAYVSVAGYEFERAGFGDRSTVHHGDFVELAPELEAAEIVTLHRVVCCYGDWRALVDASTARATRLYGLVIPNERWWLRAGIGIGNLALRISGRSFRGYVHPEGRIHDRIRRAGFERRSHHRGWIWQTSLYERSGDAG